MPEGSILFRYMFKFSSFLLLSWLVRHALDKICTHTRSQQCACFTLGYKLVGTIPSLYGLVIANGSQLPFRRKTIWAASHIFESHRERGSETRGYGIRRQMNGSSKNSKSSKQGSMCIRVRVFALHPWTMVMFHLVHRIHASFKNLNEAHPIDHRM